MCMCIVYESINICALPREEKLVFCKKKKNVWKQELVITSWLDVFFFCLVLGGLVSRASMYEYLKVIVQSKHSFLCLTSAAS